MLIEQANYTRATAYKNLDILQNEKVTAIDKYILTNYNKLLPSALYEMLCFTSIERIYLPFPKNETEQEIFENANKLQDVFRTQITTYKTNSEITGQNFKFYSQYREGYKTTGARNIFDITYNSDKYTYLSSGILRDETKNAALSAITKSDVIIFGRHGASYYNYNFVYEISHANKIIFASKNMYISDYMLNFYKKSGADVYLTPEKVDFIH